MNDLTDNAEKAIAVANTNISQAQELMAEAHKVMAQQAENLTKETAKFEERTKILEHVHFGRTIRLNIGGKIYKTTLDTLQKDPDCMLATMFSGRFDVKPCEDDGAYFIDRDGKTFRYILNYLRTGELVYPDDKDVKRQLFLEAEFYQIEGIIKDLKSLLRMSAILTENSHEEILMGWLPRILSYGQLLFRASRDGILDFHRYCDGKGPTLVLIKCGSHIFGGYTEKSWSSPAECTFIKDDHSFLFSISKAKQILSNGSGGLRCHNVQPGPSFGNCNYSVLEVEGESSSTLKVLFDPDCFCSEDEAIVFPEEEDTPVDELEVFEFSPHWPDPN